MPTAFRAKTWAFLEHGQEAPGRQGSRSPHVIWERSRPTFSPARCRCVDRRCGVRGRDGGRGDGGRGGRGRVLAAAAPSGLLRRFSVYVWPVPILGFCLSFVPAPGVRGGCQESLSLPARAPGCAGGREPLRREKAEKTPLAGCGPRSHHTGLQRRTPPPRLGPLPGAPTVRVGPGGGHPAGVAGPEGSRVSQWRKDSACGGQWGLCPGRVSLIPPSHAFSCFLCMVSV